MNVVLQRVTISIPIGTMKLKATKQVEKRACAKLDFGRVTSAENCFPKYKGGRGAQNTPRNYFRLSTKLKYPSVAY